MVEYIVFRHVARSRAIITAGSRAWLEVILFFYWYFVGAQLSGWMLGSLTAATYCSELQWKHDFGWNYSSRLVIIARIPWDDIRIFEPN